MTRDNDYRLVLELSIAYPVRLVGVGAKALAALSFVHLIIAFAPDRLAVALESEDVRGDAVEKPAVVADDHGATAEVQQGIFQSSQRLHVEVIGRLVEQKQIAAATEQLGQVNAIALAARQLRHFALLVGSFKIKLGHIAARGYFSFAQHQVFRPAGDFLKNGLAGVERVAILIDIGGQNRVADAQAARIRLLLADNHAEKRGLAGAVRADDAHNPALGKIE